MAEKEIIQEVPEGWKLNNVKKTAYLKGRIGWQGLRAEEFIEEGPFLVTGTDFMNGRINWDSCYHVSYERYKVSPSIHLKDGDLLITKDGTIGKVALVTHCPKYAVLNSGIFLIRPIKDAFTNEYFYYLLTSKIFTKFLQDTQTGSTIKHLYQYVFEKFIFSLPNTTEQRAIASILFTCDEAIEKTDAKIEKLRRIKQGLMQDLFRYGIDENGNLRNESTHHFKDSPLGRIPEEWEVVELKNVTQSYDGMRFPIKEEDRQGINGNYPYYGASGVIDWINKCKYDGEYLLLAEDGENILSHNLPIAFIARGKFWVNNHVHVYQPNNDMSILFLQAYLDTLDYASFNTSSAQPKLTASACSKLTLVKPPKPEQSRIASFLSSSDEAIEKEDAYKNKLHALKRGLMEDLLNGKVRVNKLIKEAA